jgi:hypothetical protein
MSIYTYRCLENSIGKDDQFEGTTKMPYHIIASDGAIIYYSLVKFKSGINIIITRRWMCHCK